MAKIGTHRCNGEVKVSHYVRALWYLHAAAYIALIVYVNWNYCHLSGKGPCRTKSRFKNNDYVRSNLTSAQKKKCEKYNSGVTTYIQIEHKNLTIAFNLHSTGNYMREGDWPRTDSCLQSSA